MGEPIGIRVYDEAQIPNFLVGSRKYFVGQDAMGYRKLSPGKEMLLVEIPTKNPYND